MFTRVLVPLDRSPLSEEAAATAASIARATRGELSFILAHQMPPYGGFASTAARAEQIDRESIYIREMAEEVARGAMLKVSGAVETGPPAEVISHRAHEIGADLIVMTSHGRTGLQRAWAGSVADGVLRQSGLPVLVLRHGQPKPHQHGDHQLFHRVLVPLDRSPESAAILEPAIRFAKSTKALLIIARIVQPDTLYLFDAGLPTYPTLMVNDDATREFADTARQDLLALGQRIEKEAGIHVETEVAVADRVADAVLHLARRRHADVIAMSTHGRDLSRLLIASLTDRLLQHSDLPLLLYHPRPVHTATVQPERSTAHATASLSPA